MYTSLPPWIILDPLLNSWLLEDIGRGDRTTAGLFTDQKQGQAQWILKERGVIVGFPMAARVFQLLNSKVQCTPLVTEGEWCEPGQPILQLEGAVDSLLMGERVALNLVMSLSGVATLTRQYVDKIADLPTKLVDTRKTTPGLRLLEKYATLMGGAINHRMGLDDAVMIKDNHIVAAGGIVNAVTKVREAIPYPLTIEVETETLAQVEEALTAQVDIIMLDNMSLEQMRQAVEMIEAVPGRVKIEASGNITLKTIRAVAETGVHYISTSAPITRSTWLDISQKFSYSRE